jgi:aryl-alcohol dehydrogenase-like predicted oxidoreductase
LYYIHRLADDVNLDELMQTLKLLRDTGKIRHIGFSELTPDQIKTVFSKAAEYDLKIAAIENEVAAATASTTKESE